MTYSRRLIQAALCLALALMFVPQFLTPTQAQTAPVTPAPTQSATPVATVAATTSATSAPTSAATVVLTVAATTSIVAPGTITVDGSAIVSPIVKQVADAYTAKHADVKIDLGVSGTSGGFDKLCAGVLDINLAVTGISDPQAAACTAKNVTYVEVLLGFDATVVVVNTASTVNCIGVDELNKLLSPSAAGAIKDFNQIVPTTTPQPIGSLYATKDSRARDLISSLVSGATLRGDISQQDTAAAVVDKLVAEPTSIGLLTLSDFQTASAAKAVRMLNVKNGTTCIAPNVANLEEARYPAGESLYAYVNIASLSRASVADFMNTLVGFDGQNALTAKGFIQADASVYTRDTTYLSAKQSGRTFSRIQSVNVPADTTGTVNAAGSAAAFPILKAVADAFQPRYTKITLTQTDYSNDDGYSKLCASTTDLIGVTRAPTDAELAACKTNNVATITLNLGAQGVVLLINPGNTFATCLTLDQLGKLFGADANGKVMKWSDVDAKFPTTDLLILSPADGSTTLDLLVQRTVKGIAPLPRHDMTTNDDPLYRAAGTANAANAITLMSYSEYKKVTSKVTLVGVDGGKGCVTPTDQTVADGSYALSQKFSLVLNQNAFTRPEVKAFVWYLLSDDALAVIADKGNVLGTDRAAFTAARETALQRFSQPPVPPTVVPVGTAAGTMTPVPTAATS